MPFIPHTETDIAAMLATIGVASIEDLFDEIPAPLRIKSLKNIAPGMTEMELSQLMQQRAKQNARELCFIGAGAYEHYIPAAVWDITSRGEFLTAYTPYQAEASQGTLQLLYEYQTMMASLTGMDVSNASMYDGASALAEAILMAVRLQRHTKSAQILLPKTLHPAYRQVVKTIVQTQGIQIIEIDHHHGVTDSNALQGQQNITALVIPQPNFFGNLEDVDALTDWAQQNGALAIAVVNPMTLGVLKEPGSWGQKGADLVCGEGQPLGIPLASGGPYFGFLCCKQAYVRQMPGRIVGRTVDKAGKQGFTLTLQAREQHIRRSKATSNICTNQGLLVTAATIYMSLMGPQGLRTVASQCHANTRQLVQLLTHIPGIRLAFERPYFHEVVLRFEKPVKAILQSLAKQGIQAGLHLAEHYPELGEALLVCATETKTEADLQKFANALSQIMTESKHYA